MDEWRIWVSMVSKVSFFKYGGSDIYPGQSNKSMKC